MSRPFIQHDDEMREMTKAEYDALVTSGWTEEAEANEVTE